MKRSIYYALLFIIAVFASNIQAVAPDYWNGENYSKNSSSQKEAASDLMKFVPLKGNEVILDVGCGDGKITAEIAQKIPQGFILGVDISASMIDFANKKFPQSTYPNLTFQIKNAQDIDYNDKFDVLFSFTTLQWISNHSAFLEKAHASLKNEGIYAITMPLGLPRELEQAVNEITSLPKWAFYFDQFSSGWNFVEPNEYAELLNFYHFSPSRFEIVPQKDVFSSRAAFEVFLTQIFPYLRPLPEDQKKSFLTQVVDRFLELENFPNDEVHWKFLRLEVVAKKN